MVDKSGCTRAAAFDKIPTCEVLLPRTQSADSTYPMRAREVRRDYSAGHDLSSRGPCRHQGLTRHLAHKPSTPVAAPREKESIAVELRFRVLLAPISNYFGRMCLSKACQKPFQTHYGVGKILTEPNRTVLSRGEQTPYPPPFDYKYDSSYVHLYVCYFCPWAMAWIQYAGG